MKKVIAIAALLGLAGAAQAQVTVYGLIDAGWTKSDAVGNEGKLAYSNNSTTKVGLKGTTDLGSGFKGNFNLEAGNVTFPGKSSQFFDRQAWFSLSSGMGEIRAGTQDSVAFRALIGFDLNGAANDTMAAGLAGVPVLGQNGVQAMAGGTKELASYISPSMGGFQVAIGLTPKGDAQLFNADTTAKANSSLSLTYAQGPLAAALAFESASSDAAARANSNNYSAVAGSYDFGVAKVSGVYANGGKNNIGWSAGVAVPVAGATIGVQYAKNTDTSNTGTELFVNKEILKNTYGYFEYGITSPNVGTKVNQYSVGLMYVF